MREPGTLYIVATPIGNHKDITLRALEELQRADAILCEEERAGSTTLRKLNIQGKEIIPLNEHNEKQKVPEVTQRLLDGQNLALISDCGTPVFADPGAYLIQQAEAAAIRVVPVPGPSSLMAALSVMNDRLDRFVFAGFLSRQPETRRAELLKYRNLEMTVIVMDTPYRLEAILNDIELVFGGSWQITLAFDLTLPGERIVRGCVTDVRAAMKGRKGEFVVIIHSPKR